MEHHLLQLFTMRALHLPTQDEGHLAVAWIDVHARSARDDAPARARQVNTRGAGSPIRFGMETCTLHSHTHAHTVHAMHTAPSMCKGIDPRTHACRSKYFFTISPRTQAVYLPSHSISAVLRGERYSAHGYMWHGGRAAGAHACDARRARGVRGLCAPCSNEGDGDVSAAQLSPGGRATSAGARYVSG